MELRKLIAAQRIYGFTNLQTNGTKEAQRAGYWNHGGTDTRRAHSAGYTDSRIYGTKDIR